MAKVSAIYQNQFTMILEDDEMEIVRLHKDREGMEWHKAIEDLLEFALCHKSCEICQEEMEARTVPDAVMGMVTAVLKWPKSGPYAVLNDDDKTFVASVVAMSVREALCVVLYKRGFERKSNVVERRNEEDGSGKPVIPVN